MKKAKKRVRLNQRQGISQPVGYSVEYYGPSFRLNDPQSLEEWQRAYDKLTAERDKWHKIAMVLAGEKEAQ